MFIIFITQNKEKIVKMKKLIDVIVYQKDSDAPWTIEDILDTCTI